MPEPERPVRRSTATRIARVAALIGVAAGLLFIAAFILAIPLNDKQNGPELIGSLALFALLLALVAGALMVYAFSLEQRAQRLVTSATVADALSPSTDRFAWDAARRTLDDYIDRNLTRGAMIFYLSVAVMVVGFVVVVISIWPTGNPIWQNRVAAAGAGVLTEFIGATFLFVYQSTVHQAMVYAKMLERINSVGVAMSILKSLDEDVPLRNRTIAQLATLVLTNDVAALAALDFPDPKVPSKKPEPAKEPSV